MDAKVSVIVPLYNAELLKVSGRDAPSDLHGVDVGGWIHAERIRRFVTLKNLREEA